MYRRNPKLHLPWKRWLEIAAEEELCIINWVDQLDPPPSPEFTLRNLGAQDLRDISGPYIENILYGHSDCESFSVIPWSEGMWFYCRRGNIILTLSHWHFIRAARPS
jgi:hypothetical protein